MAQHIPEPRDSSQDVVKLGFSLANSNISKTYRNKQARPLRRFRLVAPKLSSTRDQFHGEMFFSADQRERGFTCCLHPVDGVSFVCMARFLAHCGLVSPRIGGWGSLL